MHFFFEGEGRGSETTLVFLNKQDNINLTLFDRAAAAAATAAAAAACYY
jgi:hypothetical protein